MKQESLRVGLLGYGLINQEVVRLLAERATEDITVVGALVRDPTRIRPLGPPIITKLSDLLAGRPHVIVEATGHAGLCEHGETILLAGIDLILVSVGALAETRVFQTLLEAAHKGGAHITVVSGAIGGLDALSAASVGGLTRVVHTMRKPPNALLAPEEATHLRDAYEIFRGPARQAVQQFPEFLNVAAAVALAGIGFDQTEVRIFADPTVEHSLHEVQAEGPFGLFRFEIKNQPVGGLGRGAQLAGMSIVHSLLLRRATFIIG
jgi:aspartate dehydrogenase